MTALQKSDGQMGHTPGKWRVAGKNMPECWQVETEEGDFVAQCEDRRQFASLDAVANARLIAAAPCLLEALIELDRVYETGDFETEFRPALERARVAIAKATGQ